MKWRWDTSRRDMNATTLTLVILLGITMWVAILIFRELSNITVLEGASLSGFKYPLIGGTINVSSWKKYANKTAGFALLYPNGWYVEETAVDQKTHGDVVSGGAVSARFQIAILPPSGLGVTIVHKLADYDNKQISTQWEGVLNISRPLSGDYRELKSLNGASYLRSFVEDAEGNVRLLALVPTGKYVISIQSNNPTSARDARIFDAMLQTIELK